MDFRIVLFLFFCSTVLASCKKNENMMIDVDQAINELEKRGSFKQEDVFLLNSLYLDFSLRDRLIAVDSTNVSMYLNRYNLDSDQCVDREFDTELIALDKPYSSIQELINSKDSNLYKEYIKKEGIPPFSKKYNPYLLIYGDKVYVEYSHETIPESAEVFELKDSTTVMKKLLYLLLD